MPIPWSAAFATAPAVPRIRRPQICAALERHRARRNHSLPFQSLPEHCARFSPFEACGNVWSALRVPVVAVSPIIGGAAVKGPAAKIMRELELPVSPLEIARQYRDFLDVMLVDEADAGLLALREARRSALETAPILMRTPDDRRTLAVACLDLLRRLRA